MLFRSRTAEPSSSSSTDLADAALDLEYVEVWNDRGSHAKKNVSVWQARLPEGCVSLGHTAVQGYASPTFTTLVAKVGAAGGPGGEPLVAPVRYKLAWQQVRGKRSLWVWHPVAPTGYVSLGDVGTLSDAPPDLEAVRCVAKSYVTPAQLESAVSPTSLDDQIWNDRGGGSPKDGAFYKQPGAEQPGDTGLFRCTDDGSHKRPGGDFFAPKRDLMREGNEGKGGGAKAKKGGGAKAKTKTAKGVDAGHQGKKQNKSMLFVPDNKTLPSRGGAAAAASDGAGDDDDHDALRFALFVHIPPGIIAALRDMVHAAGVGGDIDGDEANKLEVLGLFDSDGVLLTTLPVETGLNVLKLSALAAARRKPEALATPTSAAMPTNGGEAAGVSQIVAAKRAADALVAKRPSGEWREGLHTLAFVFFPETALDSPRALLGGEADDVKRRKMGRNDLSSLDDWQRYEWPELSFYFVKPPLHTAADEEELRVASIATYSGASVARAAQLGAFSDVIRLVKEEGKDVNGVWSYNDTALHMMAAVPHFCCEQIGPELAAKMMSWLLEHGADVDRGDTGGMSALGDVMKHGGSVAQLRVLLDRGADVNKGMNYGKEWNALWYCRHYKRPLWKEFEAILLEAGAVQVPDEF